MKSILLTFFLFSLSSFAFAGGKEDKLCVDISGPKNEITKNEGKWIELTEIQRAFLAGIYVLNLNTPSGLPFGEKAILTQRKDDDTGLILFQDGDKVCTPMMIPKEIIDMMNDVGSGKVLHEGDHL